MLILRFYIIILPMYRKNGNKSIFSDRLRKSLRLLTICMAAMLLGGCGKSSAGKQAEVGEILEGLQSARARAQEVYDSLYDDSLYAPLQEAGKKVDVFGETEVSEMTDQEIDAELIPAMKELEGVYQELQEQLDSTAAVEETKRREREGKKQITFFVINKSGAEVPKLIWTEKGMLGQSERLKIKTPLAVDETLAGLTVTVTEEADSVLLLCCGESQEESPVYEIGGTEELSADTVYYLILLPEGQFRLISDPKELSEDGETAPEGSDKTDQPAPEAEKQETQEGQNDETSSG